VLVVISETSEMPVEQPTPAAPPPTATAVPIVGTLVEEAEIIETPSEPMPAPEPTPGRPTSVKALPVVRKLARDAGLELETVKGTGTGGRITREDVESAIAASPVSASSPREVSPPSTPLRPDDSPSVGGTTVEIEVPARDDERRPMSRLRRTIAANMSKSWAEVPHVTTFDDVDATRLLEVRAALSERHETKIPIEALVVRAVLPALYAFPEFNATLDGDDLLLHGAHDIGVAVDTPDGLLVAVIRNADSMGVLDLAVEISRLGDGARERKLSPDELTGQTFTVSNIGAVGGGHGTPIVPPGTTAILSVGRAKEKPIVDDGDLVIAPVMPLSLSYDHRVIDGGLGRRFMSLLMENLEEPALFLTG
jgi:pyruvate dehydrogenase E2 component (dihydrolipoamide acetyltransferase)